MHCRLVQMLNLCRQFIMQEEMAQNVSKIIFFLTLKKIITVIETGFFL